jgi:hypothetical protein
MFTLLGLYDLASVRPGSVAGDEFSSGMRTLATVLPRYDVNGDASYDLTQLTIPGERPDLSPDYQAIDVYLLRALLSTGNAGPAVRRFAEHWAAGLGD